MYKLTKSKTDINVNKLHSELGDLGLPYFLTYNDTEFFLSFPDIKREEAELLDENEAVIDTVVTFKKRIETVVSDTDEEGNKVENKVTDWVEFDFSVIESQIELTINNHNPSPLQQPKTEIQKMQEAIDFLLMSGGI